LAAFGLVGLAGFGSQRDLETNERETLMTENAASNKPTIVFSHGAFADSSGWNDIISTLRALGYPVFATSNPLRGVKYDTDYTAATIRGIRGPIVLVGHSYGGMVINGVASGNKQVKALVFVSAFAPEAGESAADLSGKFPGGTLGPTLAPPVPLPDGSNDLYIQEALFRAQFCADVPEPQAARMAASQRPCTELALNEKASGAVWKSIPSWFVWGELDKNIPAASHRFMAERANAREALEIKGGSHVVLIANADAVAQVILHAAKHAK
jgi:pimeloyl-ACP methyl ester carboxylesterase